MKKLYMLNKGIDPDLFFGGEVFRCLTAEEIKEVFEWMKKDNPDFSWTLETHFHEATQEEIDTYGFRKEIEP